MFDESVAKIIAEVKTESKKEKDRLIKMLSNAKSVLAAGQNLDTRRQGQDKTWHDDSMVHQITNMKEDIKRLHMNFCPEFPNISFNSKYVARVDIDELIGTYTISREKYVIVQQSKKTKRRNMESNTNDQQIVGVKKTKHSDQ
ncbi:uncharacterized protein LOC143055320 [Mytilus galloprovincialis]|uniref:uncharacterized protein LOC143055320 n=1 Tax=Mytilus galloprovincialis TaxID=29158 RepID=UPI003F7BDE37